MDGRVLALVCRFMAYSDMAIGLGLLFGLQLPINFKLKATSIIEQRPYPSF